MKWSTDVIHDWSCVVGTQLHTLLLLCEYGHFGCSIIPNHNFDAKSFMQQKSLRLLDALRPRNLHVLLQDPEDTSTVVCQDYGISDHIASYHAVFATTHHNLGGHSELLHFLLLCVKLKVLYKR